MKYTHDRTIVDLFCEQASKTPDNIAVIFGSERLSYRELDQASERFAADLLVQAPNSTIIGVSATRSINMIVRLVAVFKSRRPYLPLDLSLPFQRLAQIATDANLSHVACDAHDERAFEALGLSPISHSQPNVDGGEPGSATYRTEAGYVLYTSGSTGVPKGVHMGELALRNLLTWQRQDSAATVGTRTLQFAPLTFDVSFQEIFATLTTGGTLVLVDDDIRLNPIALLEFLEQQCINRVFLPYVALQLIADTAAFTETYPSCLMEVMTAGEQLKITPQIIKFFKNATSAKLFNQYGPTETHVVSSLTLQGDPDEWPSLPSIGKPISNVHLLVLNVDGDMLPPGEVGELYIAGTCLANGYLNNPLLTEERFIMWNHPQWGAVRIYRSGDLAKVLESGEFEFLGRLDHQVKIRGHRVELGEIENLLTMQEAVSDAVVVALGDEADQKKLVAYVLPGHGQHFDPAKLQTELRKFLPDYMVPVTYVRVDAFPKTSSGKVDRKALPKPFATRPALGVLYRAPKTERHRQVLAIWQELLQIEQIGIDDNFFELGGNSLLAQKTVVLLHQRHSLTLPITKLYQYPTASEIASYLSANGQAIRQGMIQPIRRGNTAHEPIAIIGFGLRLPGASTVADFWDLLKAGKNTITFFRDDELDASIPSTERNDPAYVSARGIIDDAEWFDEDLFGLTPVVARIMDPQQRVFLEICRDALESAGYLKSTGQINIGVYAGAGNSAYYINNVLASPDEISKIGAFQALALNEKDYIASRVAYQLNLRGPAVTVQSACSTSLLAVAQATEALRKGHCHMALAGGVAIKSPIYSGHLYEEGAMLSPDGHCRPFDAEARGTVFSDGAAVVLLKRLADAEQDGDTIYAVIKGTGLNNDGANKSSFTAPSAEGQASAIAMALADAEVDPRMLSYIETHGTATPLGDPIEIEGLKLAFGETAAKQYCRIGSIKSNMGHLTHAAGVTGLIKTALALHHKTIPPSINYEKPNPNIDFDNSPFVVNDALTPWDCEEKRYAGVSSFGVGGTNVHVILEEFVASSRDCAKPTHKDTVVVSWSAKSETSLSAYAAKLADFVRSHPDVALADIANTLNTTRVEYNWRAFLTATDNKQLLEKLENQTWQQKNLATRHAELVFMFPGQGSQYVPMGLELYRREPIYKKAIDQCAELLISELGEDIRSVMFTDPSIARATEVLQNTKYTQPALFVTEYALAKLWMSWGIQPTAFIGHSVGEFVAAHLSGIFTLTDVLKVVAARGKLISDLPAGKMLSVRASAAQLAEMLPEGVNIAATNAPNLCVVAGEVNAITALAGQLEQEGIASRLLDTSHAFHSSMMDPMLTAFKKIVDGVSLSVPQKPIISTVTGEWLTDVEATDPMYWVRHVKSTVEFSKAISFAEKELEPVFLEVGPGYVTASLAKQHSTPIAARTIGGMTLHGEGKNEYASVLDAVGKLWQLHVIPDWAAVNGTACSLRLPHLPTYAYDRKKHWLAPSGPSKNEPVASNPETSCINEEKTQTLLSSPSHMRKSSLIEQIKQSLERASGIELDGAPTSSSFMELGLDSLLLTQIAQSLKKEFGLPITFRKLNEEYYSLDLLAEYLDRSLPQPQSPAPSCHSQTEPHRLQGEPALTHHSRPAEQNITGASDPIALISQQISLLSQQVALLQGVRNFPTSPTPQPTLSFDTPASRTRVSELAEDEAKELKKPFGATARIEKQSTNLSDTQSSFLNSFISKYVAKTPKSKAYTQQHRRYMADPRVVSGFRPATKEMTYTVVVNKSDGCRLWDIDGNEYIDALNGFGSSMLGNQPPLIKEALLQQIEDGYEIGPQHEKAGEVCRLVSEMTGLDRVALCNTGSEAVLGAMRIARTVTGRSTIAAFTNSYHGIVDEVIVRGTKKLQTYPAASGIMPEAVQNMLILDYGTDDSLEIIRERASDLAAILVEPVQSRRPEFLPVDFLKALRQIANENGCALIFDEVISGFRFHPAGIQGILGIQADIATYGKVAGAGMSVGIIAGKSSFMDALDGGYWAFGDESVPEVGVTYFAGTFVRHPLALATTLASLEYLKKQGPQLQERLNTRTTEFVNRLNRICENYCTPVYVAHYGSLWKVKFREEFAYSELLFAAMRLRGVHILDGFPCFLTTAHNAQDIDFIVRVFEESIKELVSVNFIPSSGQTRSPHANGVQSNKPPLPNARLGRDKNGNPAWFVEDENQKGRYLQIVQA